MKKCGLCSKTDEVLYEIAFNEHRCGDCVRRIEPPLLMLVLFDEKTNKWWNATSMKDEKVTDFSMFTSCGWFLRSMKETKAYNVKRIALYYEYYGTYKCLRIPESVRGAYEGNDCHMNFCEKMKPFPHVHPDGTLAWKERSLYYRNRKFV